MQMEAIFNLIPPYLKVSKSFLNLYDEINTKTIKLIINDLILFFCNLLGILNAARKNPVSEFGKVSKNLP